MTTPGPDAPRPPDPPADPMSPPQPPPGAAGSSGPTGSAQSVPAASVAARRSPAGLVAGLVLIIVGGLFLLGRVADVTVGPHAWPLWIIVPGLAMYLAAFAIPSRGGLGLAIPGAIVTTVGVVLWVQEVYGLYETWAYAWALVAPTSVGFAMLTYGLVRGDRELAAHGLRTFLIGIALFVGFAVFFEGVIGLSGHRFGNLDEIVPYVAIGLGVILVVLALVGRRGAPRA